MLAREQKLVVRHLGLVPYRDCVGFQLDTLRRVAAQEIPHRVLCVEHPPVYTLGKRGGEEHILVSRERLSELGAEVVKTDRGGLVTFHGPGQLVCYPIINLDILGLSLTAYIRFLMEAAMEVLLGLGLDADFDMKRPGIYIEARKIGSVGVRLRDRTTYHGLAINVNNDLAWFAHIHPCGEREIEVTSVAREMGRLPSMPELGDQMSQCLAERLGLAVHEAGALSVGPTTPACEAP